MKQSQTNKKIIGAIGGMGPLSSVQFYKEVIEYCQQSLDVYYNDEYPHIAITNLPIPDLIKNDDAGSIGKAMLKGEIKRLELYGAKEIAIVCNTIHMYIDEFRKESNVPVLSIVEEVSKKAVKDGHKKVALLATPTTIKSNIYQKSFEDYHLDYLIPTENEIAMLGDTLPDILGGKKDKQVKGKYLKMMERLQKAGAECFIFGCTEIGVLIKPTDVNKPIINSVTALAETVAKRSLNKYEN